MAKAGLEPGNTRVSTVGRLNHWATELVKKLESNLETYTTPKIDQIWMVFTAKNGSKWTHHWYQPFFQTLIDPLVLVADLISP